MASAFDDIAENDAEYIVARLLAGDRMGDIRAHFAGVEGVPTITAYRMRKMRDEVFGPLVTSPAAVKALANGPLLNALDVIHYTHSRKAIARGLAEQTEMFAR